MGVILLVADKRHWRPQLMACLYPCPLPWESAAPPLSSNPGWPMTCFGQQNADGTVSQFPTSRNLTGFLCSFLEPSHHHRNKASLMEAERPHGTELNCLSQGHPKPADPETCTRAQQDQQRHTPTPHWPQIPEWAQQRPETTQLTCGLTDYKKKANYSLKQGLETIDHSAAACFYK